MTHEEKGWAEHEVRFWLCRLFAQMASDHDQRALEHEVLAKELREAAK